MYESKKLKVTQAKYGDPRLEVYSAYYFILKNHSYLRAKKFILRVDNQSFSWLKTYSTDQALIGRWIMALQKYHFKVEHRLRTQNRNADGLSKQTNYYQWREQQLEKLSLFRTKGIFSHRRNLTSCPLHLGSTCTFE